MFNTTAPTSVRGTPPRPTHHYIQRLTLRHGANTVEQSVNGRQPGPGIQQPGRLQRHKPDIIHARSGRRARRAKRANRNSRTNQGKPNNKFVSALLTRRTFPIGTVRGPVGR